MSPSCVHWCERATGVGQGLDHTIYPIGDLSVWALREWQSTALGCSPGLRLGQGLAVTLRVYNAWFVPPSVNKTTLRQLENKDPLLLQGPTSPFQNKNKTNFSMLTTGTSQERLIFPWILHSNSCSKLSRATGGDIPTGLSFAWLTCLEGSFKLKSAGPCNTLDQRCIRLPEEYNLKLCHNIFHFSLDK